MDFTIALLTLSTLGLVFGVLIARWVHSRSQLDIAVESRSHPQVSHAGLLQVSVIVPARNEARNIRRCVEALRANDYPNFEIIVVDDRSTDDTSLVLDELVAVEDRHPIHVVRGVDLPPDWAGKPHALVQGAAAAKGELLCFIDADTFGEPAMLSSATLAAQELDADLFTILTDQELGTFWEKVVLPLVFTGLSFGFPAKEVNDPDQPDAIANGQFILVKRTVYDAIDGHRAVKNRIDEDKALAEVVKGAGYRLVLADGRSLATTRMYTSLSEMWEGWTKNIYLGLQDQLLLLLFGATLGFISALALPLWFLGGMGWWLADGCLPALIIALEAALLLAYLFWVRVLECREFGISHLYAFTLPLGAFIFTAMMFASAFKVISGVGVTWKGRRYT
jgi:chlorobactene glucosyltransferase